MSIKKGKEKNDSKGFGIGDWTPVLKKGLKKYIVISAEK